MGHWYCCRVLVLKALCELRADREDLKGLVDASLRPPRKADPKDPKGKHQVGVAAVLRCSTLW